MKQFKHMVALFLIIAVTITTFYHTIYIIEHQDHVCSGEGCETCVQLEISEQTLSSIKSLWIVGFFLLGSFCSVKEVTIALIDQVTIHITPITLKVKLLN